MRTLAQAEFLGSLRQHMTSALAWPRVGVGWLQLLDSFSLADAKLVALAELVVCLPFAALAEDEGSGLIACMHGGSVVE